MPDSKKLNIYQRCNEVRKAIGYIKKDATVTGYKAVTHDNVTAMVRDVVIAQGVLIVPVQTGGACVDVGTTKNGTTIIRYEAQYEIWFVNADEPEQRIRVVVHAHANDSGDKAPGKACSYAVKYAMLKLFSIETGENEESRLDESRKEAALVEHLKSELNEYIESGDSLAVFLLSQKLGQEAWTDIYNSAPDGKKVAFKKTLADMEREGAAVLKTINQAILTGSAGEAAENVEDVTSGGKRLLAEKLGHDKSVALGELLKTLGK